MALTCICPSPKPTVQVKEERRNSIKYKQYNKEHICTLLVIILSELHMSDCENPRFTERTFTNLGRSHRLPQVCTIMIYGKLGEYRLQETAVFIYI